MSAYQQLRILIIDDFDSFRMTVSKMLQEYGASDIDSAVNGQEAVRRCKDKHYDLILCDYNLGRGKNGQQVLEELRYREYLRHSGLFVLVSADSSKNIVMAAYDYEPDGYLTKPITAKALKQRLDRLLMQRQALHGIYAAMEQSDLATAETLCKAKLASAGRFTTPCQKLLGKLLLAQEKFDEAEQVYIGALEVRQLDWAKVGIAQAKFGQGDLNAAQQWLKAIIADNPLCMQAYDQLADILEAQGDFSGAQAALQQAVDISPMALLRQQRLAKRASENNDLPVAVDAYRRAVRLGVHSCRDQADMHLGFARATSALFKQDAGKAADLAKDATKILDQVHARFGAVNNLDVQTYLLEAQLLYEQNSKPKAEEKLDEAEQLMNSNMESIDIDTEIDYVLTLQLMAPKNKVDQVIVSLVTKYQKDEEALEKLDKLLDEPISKKNRQVVAAVNKEGIGYYEDKNYKNSIDCFKKAKQMFPNHIGLHLNLIQALIGEMQEYGRQDEMMDLCLLSIKTVEDKIDATHEQFQRYRQLHEQVRLLNR